MYIKDRNVTEIIERLDTHLIKVHITSWRKRSDEIIKVFMMILLNIQQREENNKGIEVCYRKGIHDFRIQFEKFVSEQEVYFFQKENFSKSMSSLFLTVKCIFWHQLSRHILMNFYTAHQTTINDMCLQ